MSDDAAHHAPTAVAAPPSSGTAFDATHAAPSQVTPSRAGAPAFAPPSALRTTVLPRVESDGTSVQLSLEARSRYEGGKLLGAGGMGEVVLVTDQDIERRVALKRLLPDMTHPSLLARFVDEIRTVGRLEHPNIVPIHDVGVDEQGRYFFVMKYVEGETLESIIEKLAAGDAAYVAKYSTEVRLELVLGLLHALEYAHAQGVVHRDIKPANVMVGRFGEVVLMDWGVSKPIAAKRDAAAGAEGALQQDEGAAGDTEGAARARKYATRVGSLVGTPAYMSPEQAQGATDKVDARSDIYSAVVLLHELMGLKHYLSDTQSVDAALAAIIGEQFGFLKLLLMKYPAPLPTEVIHVIVKGLAKAPRDRFQSAGELIAVLHGLLEGKVAVQCHITFTKRSFREMGRLVDRAPWIGFATLVGIMALVVFAVVQLVRIAMA